MFLYSVRWARLVFLFYTEHMPIDLYLNLRPKKKTHACIRFYVQTTLGLTTILFLQNNKINMFVVIERTLLSVLQ